MAEVFVGRQPIFDGESGVFAYELLYRCGEANEAVFADAHQATSEVLVNAFIEIGLEQLVEEHPAFINVTRPLILGNYCELLPSNRVVLELDQHTTVDNELTSSLGKLSDRGFRVALSGVSHPSDLGSLAQLADFVKIDVLKADGEASRELVRGLRGMGKRIVAEKVESPEQCEACKQLGFDYFQGFFFCRPAVVQATRLPVNRVSIMRLLSKLNEQDITIDEVAGLIEPDVALGFRLMKYVNSAACGLPRKVDSVREASVLLGLDRIRSLTRVMAIANLSVKTPELMVTAMQRATMCELLARSKKQHRPERFFTVGLFSALDSILGVPMPEVLKELPLSAEVADALLQHAGVLGSTLDCVLEYERGNWDAAKRADFAAGAVVSAYTQSVVWARTLARSFAA